MPPRLLDAVEDEDTEEEVIVGNWVSAGREGVGVGVGGESVVGNTRVAVAVADVVGCALEVDPGVVVEAIRVADGKGLAGIAVGMLTGDGLGSD